MGTRIRGWVGAGLIGLGFCQFLAGGIAIVSMVDEAQAAGLAVIIALTLCCPGLALVAVGFAICRGYWILTPRKPEAAPPPRTTIEK
jgi:hypothetical protein